VAGAALASRGSADVPRGRYAPSPTGWQHLGNARTALLAWLRARSDGGSFVVRVEDLDGPRTVAAAVEGNLEELRWLGLTWDEGPDVGGPFAPYRQSERSERYEAGLQKLREDGGIYACYLSRKDLRDLASAPHGAVTPYGLAERRRNEHIAPERAAAGRVPALRFALPETISTWEEVLAGPQSYAVPGDVGDPVVRRADGTWSYQFAVSVDDAEMKIEEVVRGDDLTASTAAQRMLLAALGAPPPAYLHVPLLLDVDGVRLAKRDGSQTIRALRAAGVRAERIVGLLAWTLGQLDTAEPCTPHDLLAGFDLRAVPRGPVQLWSSDLAWLEGDGALTDAPRIALVDSAEADR